MYLPVKFYQPSIVSLRGVAHFRRKLFYITAQPFVTTTYRRWTMKKNMCMNNDGMILVREYEVPTKEPAQCRLVQQKSHMD
jgi:hypothetical protein